MNDRRITKALTGATYTLSELQHTGSLGLKKPTPKRTAMPEGPHKRNGNLPRFAEPGPRDKMATARYLLPGQKIMTVHGVAWEVAKVEVDGDDGCTIWFAGWPDDGQDFAPGRAFVLETER